MKKTINNTNRLQNSEGRNVLPLAFIAVFSFVLLFVYESIVRGGYHLSALDFLLENPDMFLLNYAYFIVLAVTLSCITARPTVAATLMCLFFVTLGILNNIKLGLRYESIFPWDFSIIGAAVGMASRTNFTWYLSELAGIILTVAVIVLWIVPRTRRIFTIKLSIKRQVVTSAVSLTVWAVFTAVMLTGPITFTEGSRAENTRNAVGPENYSVGSTVQLVSSFGNLYIGTPSGYNKENTVKIAKSIIRDTDDTATPNIIVVMNESFADISSASNITVDAEALTPNMNYLKENYISGNLLAGTFGGGTANCEYEVLTGFSASFLPSGSTPYLQHIKRDIFSYPRYLGEKGYSLTAIHSYLREYWDRDKVYSHMGFDRFISEEQFNNPEIKRNFISDAELSRKVIETYEADRARGEKSFIFAVSVQNHGSYFGDDYSAEELFPVEFAESVSEETRGAVQSYLTGVHQADESLGILLDYFSKVQEPTVVVFFGDHFPQIGKLYGGFEEIGYLSTDLTLQQQNYATHNPPFAVWNNFSSEKAQNVNISQYQLLPYVTDTLGITHPAFFDHLNLQRRVYSGNSESIYLDGDGNLCDGLDNIGQIYYKAHEMLSFDLLFGQGYSADILTK